MAPVMSLEEYEARQDEINSRLRELDTEYAGGQMPEQARSEWDTLNAELDRNDEIIAELRTRQERLAELAQREENREEGTTFNTQRPNSSRGENIWDLSNIRASVADPEAASRELRDRAHRAIDGMRFAHEHADQADCQRALERLLMVADGEEARVSQHILRTGSPQYQRAFGRALQGAPLNVDQQRMLYEARVALGLDAAQGGYAVPVQLDPTVLPTSNGVVNPLRRISRVVQTTVNKWQGVTSAGITAAYGDEAVEATDNSPVLAQPDVDVEKAHAFVPFSIEIGQDWSSLQSEMAVLLQDAKDTLEATKFLLGAGHGAHEPAGLVPGATTTLDSIAKDAFAVGDLYALEAAVPPRYRARARWMANRAIYQRVRQFDTSGGAALWMMLGQGLDNNQVGNTNASLIGYPAEEASDMETSIAAAKLYAVLGDFSRFLIVDRVGMAVEVIPHLFGPVANYPTGQRGLYAWWRNSSDVLDPNAFRVLKGHA